MVFFMLLKFAVKDFIDDRKLKNLSVHSLTSYSNTLDLFNIYCLENEIVNVEDITSNFIKSYLIDCQERGNKPSSINHKIRNLKVFFQHLCNEEIIPEKKNPMLKITYQKEDIEIGAFNELQVRQMLNYYRRINRREMTYYSVRDYCMIMTLLGTGIRLGEMCNVKWPDVDFTNAKLTVIGKKRVARTIPLTEKLVRELKEFKFFKEQYLENPDTDQYVFSNINHKRLTENAIKCTFKRLKEIMNFQDVRLSCHSFRHTFAKNWIMNGGDVFSLQKILGHTKLEMTQKYVNLFGSEIKEQNDKFNPLNNMDID